MLEQKGSAWRRRTRPVLFALSLAAFAGSRLAAEEVTLFDEMNAALASKRLCSALWVSGRQRDEAWRNSASTFLDDKAQQAQAAGSLRFVVDTGEKVVTASWQSIRVRARFFGDQGCVILRRGSDDPLFTPLEVQSRLPHGDTVPWPMGDLPEPHHDGGVDGALVDQALDLLFSHPEDHNAAFVAVHRGHILAERYGPGIDEQTQLESWSMGKSLTATLVGLLIEQGHLGLWDRAPVPEWNASDADPRSAIRIADLLRMSSGLFFTHATDDAARLQRSFVPGQPDHSLGYVTAIDVFQFSESRPLEHPPNTVGRYRNCDPLTLGAIVRRTVERLGYSYLDWPQRALFDRIGIRRQVLETDLYGNFVLTGFDFGTARNWARLGMLYLQDGVWMGERLLPEGFVDFVSTPAPAWPDGEYGGLFWLDHPVLPEGTFSMRGAGGQEVSIVPTHDLVLVRLGHSRGAGTYAERLHAAYRLILQAVPGGAGAAGAEPAADPPTE